MNGMPKHIGFIMDGNGRWATMRGMPRIKGHRAGTKTVDTVVELAQKFAIPHISLFVFSTENWSRPKSEVDSLFNLARDYLKKVKNFSERNVKVVISGSRQRIPQDLCDAIDKIQRETAHCTGLTLNLCVNYGGRDEIFYAVNKLISNGATSVDENAFRSALYCSSLPDLDLVVRTSGELRLSNFMLFQSAYAELYFTEVLWPDFGEEEFVKMLNSFERRSRRFGDV